MIGSIRVHSCLNVDGENQKSDLILSRVPLSNRTRTSSPSRRMRAFPCHLLPKYGILSMHVLEVCAAGIVKLEIVKITWLVKCSLFSHFFLQLVLHSLYPNSFIVFLLHPSPSPSMPSRRRYVFIFPFPLITVYYASSESEWRIQDSQSSLSTATMLILEEGKLFCMVHHDVLAWRWEEGGGEAKYCNKLVLLHTLHEDCSVCIQENLHRASSSERGATNLKFWNIFDKFFVVFFVAVYLFREWMNKQMFGCNRA